MIVHEIALTGCTPEPLMGYLKALGILRLVAEQNDSNARGCWRDGMCVLRSSVDEAHLVRFFLEEYRPTPIVVPWSGGDFFGIEKKGRKGPFRKTPTSTSIIEAFLGSTSDRLADYRHTILVAASALEACGIADKKQMEDKKAKARFISCLRAMVNDKAVEWIDACAVLSAEKASFSSLLGSGGGSDGNTHFSDNFMQNLWEVLPDFDAQRTTAARPSCDTLRNALWGTPTTDLVPKRTSMLFDAGAVGGPNAGQGFERVSLGNPWSIVLCLEGALLLSGSITRRYGAAEKTGPSFPFQVRLTPTGLDSASEKESAGREIWMPLWHDWASIEELVSLYSEGRGSLGTTQVAHGVDFARAAASLGVDRGIAAFQRFAIVRGRVGGENYNTSAVLGRFEVRARPDVDLLREADGWLGRFRGAASDEKAPPRFRSALRRIEGAIFDFCQRGGAPRFAEILCSLGRAEREMATGERFRKDSNLSPLAGLSPDWLRAANDASFEYEIALSLAGVYDRERAVGPLRANLEPVTWPGHPDWRGYPAWAEKSRAVVWSSTDLTTNLVAVLDRRLMDGDRNNCAVLPLAFRRSVSIDAVSVFLAGRVNDARIEDLLWGLLLVDHGRPYPQQLSRPRADPPPLPRAYALLKLLFLSSPLAAKAGEVRVRPEPSLVPLLRAGRLGDACTLAMRRLRASGLMPMPYRSGGRATRDDEWEDVTGSVEARRLAAALLLPLSPIDVTHLTALVLRPGEEPL